MVKKVDDVKKEEMYRGKVREKMMHTDRDGEESETKEMGESIGKKCWEGEGKMVQK